MIYKGKNMCSERLFNDVVMLLSRGCTNIQNIYYEVPQSDYRTVFRERVYAYELYHQLRNLMNDESFRDLYLNGELDKAGRNNFKKEKPDLLFHSPGNDGLNIASVEIKNRITKLEINTAINSLLRFKNNYGYFSGVLLIYGNYEVEVIKKMITETKDLTCILHNTSNVNVFKI